MGELRLSEMRPHGGHQPHPVTHDVQQAVQVADRGLHGSLGVLHRETGEGPATVIEGEVSALGQEQGQEKETLGWKPGDTTSCVRAESHQAKELFKSVCLLLCKFVNYMIMVKN